MTRIELSVRDEPDPHLRYARHHFPAEVISYAVWLYFRFPLSLRMVEEMLASATGRMHENPHAGPDHHVLQQAMIRVQVDGQETSGCLKVQSLRLRPHQICRSTHVRGIAVEESVSKHWVAGSHMLDLAANVFHPA